MIKAAIAAVVGVALTGLTAWGGDTIKAVLNWLMDLPKAVALAAFDVVKGWVPDDAKAYFTATPWEGLRSSINLVNWFIPFWALLALIITIYGIAATIRGIRWVWSMVPVVGR